MLGLVTIFLATFLIAMTAVWLYRLVFSWKGLNHSLVGRRRTTMKMKLSGQQGYISLAPRSTDNSAKFVRLRSVRGGVKAPWGW